MPDLPCHECGARCCRYASVCLAREDENDYELITWLLEHEGMRVYIDDKGYWIVIFPARCKQLSQENRCMIYESRPLACREFGEDGKCDYPAESDVVVSWNSRQEYEEWRAAQAPEEVRVNGHS